MTGASYEQVVSLEHWLEADPHLPAKSTLKALSSDPDSIAKLFASQISFGTPENPRVRPVSSQTVDLSYETFSTRKSPLPTKVVVV